MAGWLLLSASQAEARPRRYSSAAAAAARKKQMIATLQKQLAAARQVLSAAENQAQLSQGEVNQAISKLSDIRSSMELEEENAREAAKELNELETEILAKESFGSEYKQTQTALVTAKESLHELFHKRFPKMPKHAVDDEAAKLHELAAVTSEDRKVLEGDKEYQEAAELVEMLGKKLAAIKKKLFEADSEWDAARKESAEATKKVREGKSQASATGIGSLDDRKNLRNATNVAAYARGMIMQFEMQLARLGAKPAAPPKGSQSGKK
jgi:chromosome segregation ATPase